MPPDPLGDVLFDETQRLHENRIVRFVVPASSLTAVGVALPATLAPGSAPPGLIALIVGMGVGVPLLLAFLPMRTTVGTRALRVRSVVWFARTIPVEAITSANAVRYNPIRDCGGWGLRRSRRHGLVMNVSGDRGAHVTSLDKGREASMLIGSRRAEELAAAIRVAAGLDAAPHAHDGAS